MKAVSILTGVALMLTLTTLPASAAVRCDALLVGLSNKANKSVAAASAKDVAQAPVNAVNPELIGRQQVDVRWPELRTDQDIVQFLLSVEKKIPQVWDGMSDYGIDYFDMLRRRQALIDAAHNDPWLAQQILRHSDPIDMTVKVSSSVAANSSTPSYDMSHLKELGQTIAVSLNEFSGSKDLKAQIWQTLNEMKAFDKEATLGAFLAKFARGFPDSEKGKIFKLSVEERKNLFKNNMTPDMVRKSFSEKEIQKANLLTPDGRAAAIQAAEARENRIQGMVALAAFIGRAGSSQDPAELSTALANLTAADASFFGNKEDVKQALQNVLKDPSTVKRASEYLKEQFDQFATAVVPTAEEIDEIELQEELALLGDFRGCPAGGCLTKNMWAYSSLPHSHTFFIDPNRGGGRGVAETAVVESYGTRFLYITFLDGPALGPDKAERVVRALYNMRDRLGVQGIMLPTYDDLGGHVNNSEIRERMRALVAGKPEVNFVNLDNPLRERLRPYVNDPNYYAQDRVNKAVIFDPQTGPLGPHGSNEHMSISLQSAPAFTPSSVEVPKGEILLLAYNIDQNSSNRDLANRILHGGGAQTDEYERIKQVLLNPNRLKSAEYFASVDVELKPYGLAFDPTFKQVPLDVYYSGLLRCPDAFGKKWAAKSVLAALELLNKGSDLDEVAKVIGENKPLFEASKKLHDYLAALFTYDHAHGYGRTWHRVQVLAKAQFNLSVFPDLENVLLSQLDKDYKLRRSGGGTLLLMNQHPERAFPALFGLNSEARGLDDELNRLFNTLLTNNPEMLKKGLADGLKSPIDWVRNGARYTIGTLEKYDHSIYSLLH
jgi:hypothetical protein